MPPSWIQANSPRGEGAKPRASAGGSRVAERSEVNFAHLNSPRQVIEAPGKSPRGVLECPRACAGAQGKSVNYRGTPGVARLRMVLAMFLSALVTDVRAARIRDEAVRMLKGGEDE